jgi:hypothetical protein
MDRDNAVILQSEFSEDFIAKMKNRMIASYYKYGPLALNAHRANPQDNINIISSLITRLRLYEETGNTEWLVDIGNFAMIEFMYPQHPSAHFRATDSSESPGVEGITFRELEKK